MPSPKPLKVICLNAWAGMIGIETLSAFFAKYRDTDIFCLQEVYDATGQELPKMAAGKNIEAVEPRLLEIIRGLLPEHASYFTPQYRDYMGIAMFVHNRLAVSAHGDVCIYKEPGYVSELEIADHSRIMQHVTIETDQGPCTIANVHAAWQSVGKLDTPGRLEQSQRIIRFLRSIDGPFVLCGDFNLLPDTASIRLLEQAGLENLITSYGITSTRTPIYEKPERYADYAFVRDMRITDFRVLPDVVSDHAALFVEAIPEGTVGARTA